jgi:nitroreductase
VAYDTRFFDRLDEWAPGSTGKAVLTKDPALAELTALRNGSLQGAYLILAARALGLGAGPMSGFNSEAVNREFFASSTWRANFLVNLGFPDGSVPRPRAARVPFEDAVRIE